MCNIKNLMTFGYFIKDTYEAITTLGRIHKWFADDNGSGYEHAVQNELTSM